MKIVLADALIKHGYVKQAMLKLAGPQGAARNRSAVCTCFSEVLDTSSPGSRDALVKGPQPVSITLSVLVHKAMI